MASVPTPGRLDSQLSGIVQEFAAEHYAASGAQRLGLDAAAVAAILADVVDQGNCAAAEAELRTFLASLRLEELVLARACADGNDRAWDIFLTRYRATLYESAYKIAREESVGRELADSLYADLYGVDQRGQQRTCKLRYYQGRGSLQGWLRTVVAQEYVNRYRRARRETSLDGELEQGKQFEAPEADPVVADPRIEAAASAELARLGSEERFLLASYYLDHRTLADIAKLMRVHESTISRRLERITSDLRKRIRKHMIEAGMSPRQADEALQEVDVRDLRIEVSETLRQGMRDGAFYKEKGQDQG
jgi:RNA polymerase sigma-70 factor, ECF subfamily